MYKSHVSIQQVSSLSDVVKTKLIKWWRPEMGDWYFDKRFSFPCVVPQEVDLSYYKSFPPLLDVGQMIRMIGPEMRPKIFKVTKGQQRYYKESHIPKVNLPLGWWVVWARRVNQSPSDFQVYKSLVLVDALWLAVCDYLSQNTN